MYVDEHLSWKPGWWSYIRELMTPVDASSQNTLVTEVIYQATLIIYKHLHFYILFNVFEKLYKNDQSIRNQ